MIKFLGIILLIGTIALGALGYFEKLFSWEWRKKVSWCLLVIFFLLSIGQIILDKIKDVNQAEEFYDQEMVEVFPHNVSEKKLQFFIDNKNNNCVAIILEQKPIPKSLKLWEGGYIAPPITLAFDKQNEKRIIFMNSAYLSYEDYQHKKGPIYQVRYFPKR